MHKLIFVLTLAALIGCGDAKAPPAPSAPGGSSTAANNPPAPPPPATVVAPPTAPPPPTVGKKPVAAETTGSISGTVKIDGDPTIKKIKEIAADPFCGTQHTDPVMVQDYVIGDGKSLGNVVVFIKSGHGLWQTEPGTGELLLDQVGCVYTPHVTALSLGQSLKVKTQDATNHNVNFIAKYSESFNVQMNNSTPPKIWKAAAPEQSITVRCQIHPWMNAWVHVFDHPWHAVTAKDGKFALSGVPPGDYELAFWHETMGTQTVKVTVGQKEAKTQDFTFKYQGK